ncbi:MAG: FAD:protein FMN transferase [Thermoleophilia bacterium]|nr:FAD:protein FMN transferase [Thermoleophilia bacterium]
MNAFRSMGCEIVLPDGVPDAGVRALFDERDRRFSRFLPSSELSRVNAAPRGLTSLSEEFASMLRLALGAARATGGLVTPAAGAALVAAGYDRDFDGLPTSEVAVGPGRVAPLGAVTLFGRFLLRTEEVILDLNGVVKGKTVDDAVALLGTGWVAAGGDIATTVRLVVGLPGGGTVTLDRGGLATSSIAKRAWKGGHHLIDPATGGPSTTPWRDVTVAASSCATADVAAKAALLLGPAGPSWLDRRGLPGRFVSSTGGITLNQTWQQLAG